MKTDSELKSDVEYELKWDPNVNASDIVVAIENGAVVLTGHVRGYVQKHAAERAARRVAGVTAVVNELHLRMPPCDKLTDSKIAAAGAAAMQAHCAALIEIAVRSGWATLEGEVESQYEKKAIESAIRDVHGVNGVTSHLTAHHRVSTIEVKEKIEAAFKRSSETDARGIAGRGGNVILQGDVRSTDEREEAQKAVWAVPGVISVENDLVVAPRTW